MLEKAIVKGILTMYVDANVQQCHLIIAGISIDYGEQVVITDIKLGIQYSMCQVFFKEHENLYKI